MIPLHKSPKNNELRTTARYNFIPLPQKIVPAQPLPDQDCYHANRLTGQIVCDLEARTPLYTRGAVKPDMFRRYEKLNLASIQNNADLKAYADFFHYDANGQPVISGSSLRGMVRSLCEILAYGKVKWVSDRQLIYRSVGDVSSIGDSYREQFFGAPVVNNGVTVVDYPSDKVRGGYLRNKGSDWYIQPAPTDDFNNSFIHVEYTTCQAAGLMASYYQNYSPDVINVFIQPAARSQTRPRVRNRINLAFNLAVAPAIQSANGALPKGFMKGKLIFSHPFVDRVNNPVKHRHVVVYDCDNRDAVIPFSHWLKLSDEQMRLIREDEGISRNRAHKPRQLYGNDGEPVMYLVDAQNSSQVIFFGPTKMFRLPYQYVPRDFVEPDVRDEGVIDLPEAVFGFVRERTPNRGETDQQAKERVYAGRVFFSDGNLSSTIATQPMQMPQVLSTPKPTSFQNYLVQDAENAVDTSQLFHYNTDPDNGQTAIRGLKQYWHQDVARSKNNLEEQRENIYPQSIDEKVRNARTIIRPVPEGTKFQFTVRFENLTPEELGMLLWALSLPLAKTDGTELCHHLGMGKSLGMGSVHITPHLFKDDRQARYQNLFQKDDQGQTQWAGIGLPREEAQQNYLDAFEAYIMKGIEKTSGKLIDEDRILDLAVMLRFPGPEADKIADPGFRNKKRHILPTPGEVLNDPTAGTGPISDSPSPSRTRGRPQPEHISPPPTPELKRQIPPEITSNPPTEHTRQASEDFFRFLEKRRNNEEEEE